MLQDGTYTLEFNGKLHHESVSDEVIHMTSRLLPLYNLCEDESQRVLESVIKTSLLSNTSPQPLLNALSIAGRQAFLFQMSVEETCAVLGFPV